MRERLPTLPSTLVKTAKDQASEALKSTKLEKKINKKSKTIRYYTRTFKFYSD
ncbi:MAG: hypothetical protein ACP5SF_02200 [Thermoplasmata archaeon]